MAVDETVLEQLLALGRRYDYEEEHALQDARLAMRIFDQTEELHDLDEEYRDLLYYAAIVHDIGYWYGYDRHHKDAYRMIMDAALPGLTDRQKLLVANVARYHRSARPKLKHKSFAALSPDDQDIVTMLGAILRLADGLDRTHTNAVEDVECEVAGDRVILTLYPPDGNEMERWAGQKKSRFFADVFDVAVEIR